MFIFLFTYLNNIFHLVRCVCSLPHSCLFTNVRDVIHHKMHKPTFILAVNYNSFIWIALSLEESDAKTNGFQQYFIRQFKQLMKGLMMKNSSLQSMEGTRWLKNILPDNCSSRWNWFEKDELACNPWQNHEEAEPFALTHAPLRIPQPPYAEHRKEI